MGVEFSHCDGNWAYSHWAEVTEVLRKAARNKKDPILLLAKASVDHGKIKAKDCAKVADRLAEIIQGWPKAPEHEFRELLYPIIGADEIDHYRMRTQVIPGLRDAAESGEDFVLA